MRNCNLRKRVLVTGGAGFLGSHLCRRLPGDGRDVLCVDDLFTGAEDNIAHLIADPHFELTRCSVSPTSIPVSHTLRRSYRGHTPPAAAPSH